MYFFEWMFYDDREPGEYDRLKKKAEEKARKSGKPLLGPNVTESISSVVTDNDSFYAYNDTYIDVRTPHDEKRGLITLVLGYGFFLFFWMLGSTASSLINGTLTGFGK